MKDDDLPTQISITTATATATVKKDNSSEGSVFGRIRIPYKFWVLAAILLLAIWSVFTGSITLKWSSGDLTHFSHDLHLPLHDDLDILEVEERERVVRRMWDVYTHSSSVRLPRFWLEAFKAAYDHLASDVPADRDAAVSEIAKMSMRSINLDPLPLSSTILDKRERMSSKQWKVRI